LCLHTPYSLSSTKYFKNLKTLCWIAYFKITKIRFRITTLFNIEEENRVNMFIINHPVCTYYYILIKVVCSVYPRPRIIIWHEVQLYSIYIYTYVINIILAYRTKFFNTYVYILYIYIDIACDTILGFVFKPKRRPTCAKIGVFYTFFSAEQSRHNNMKYSNA